MSLEERELGKALTGIIIITGFVSMDKEKTGPAEIISVTIDK